jgi:hypothetical protein
MLFVGRQAKLEHVRALLANPNLRMVTLPGQGGVGKIRLALELAASFTGFEHGVVILSLAALSGSDEFKPKMAKVFGNPGEVILNGLKAYHDEVIQNAFPAKENWFGMKDDEYEELVKMLD